jgi:hypothetical protein
MAAGLGFKDFTTGEVLTAADVDGYLMQGIWVFASAAARDAAVTSPQEGNACYLKDTNAVQTYSGSAWVAVGGGSSPLTTKGDLYTYSTTDARLPVGANDLLLTAASGESTGLKYTGTWTSWSPSTSGITVGNGTLTTRYQQISKTVNLYFKFVLGSTSAITGGFNFSLPVNHAQTGLNDIFEGAIFDVGVNSYRCFCEVDGNTAYGKVSNSSTTYLSGSSFSSTVPMTWGTGDVLIIKGTYEVA